MVLIKSLFMILIFSFICAEKHNLYKHLKLIDDSEIILTIKGKDQQQILNNNSFIVKKDDKNIEINDIFNTSPSEIFVNGYQKAVDFYVYDLENEENIIAIRFNEKLKNCNGMFYGLSNIININFMNFTFSEVNSMIAMFGGCSSLQSIDLTNFNVSSVTDMSYMFYNCINLKSLNLNLFDISSVSHMDYMFYNCISLQSIELNIFNTLSSISMNYMFYQCSNLLTLKINAFKTISVSNMSHIFYNCSSIKSLDFKNINTSSVTDMSYMFYRCSNLESLDLSNFNTSSVTTMNLMFCQCKSLQAVNLCNFDVSSVSSMRRMFSNCNNLLSLNLSNFITSSVTDMSLMFYECQSLVSLDITNFDTSSVNTMRDMFYSCSNLRALDLQHFDTSLVTDMGFMMYNCKNLISINLSNFNTSSVTIINHMFCGCKSLKLLDLSSFNTSLVKNMTKMFYNCHNLLSIDLSNFQTNNVIDMNNLFFNCSNLISLDLSNIIISSNTAIKNIFDLFNNNTIYCINNSNSILASVLLEKGLTNNNCSDICFNENKKILFSNGTCALDCSGTNKYYYNYQCYSSCPIGTHNITDDVCIENDFNFYSNNIIKLNINDKDSIILHLKHDLKHGYLDNYISNIIEKENKDLIFEENKIIYQLTSSYNQIKNKHNNISTINLGLCETKLKQYHNISDDEPLLLLKIDIFKEGLLIPIIEYEVYNIKTKELLNLTICKDVKIDIHISVNIDENNLFKYNSSDDYYNDICYTYTTENNTDIILEDRRNEYLNNNYSLCENNCNYSKYDYYTKEVLCECFVKVKFPLISEIEINPDKLLNQFRDIQQLINLNVMKCYYLLLEIEGLISNIGFYILSAIILNTIILCIRFKIKGYALFKKQIGEIINYKLINIKTIEQNNNIKTNPVKKKKKKKKFNKENNQKRNIKKKDDTINDRFLSKKKDDTIIDSFFSKKKNIVKESNENNNINYNDYELNTLPYDIALKIDKRTYFQFYYSLLKTKQVILFTFCNSTDHNSKIIKIILFFFSFSLYYAVNTLFFDDKTMHRIYIDQGNFNFIYQIPKILYSTIISSFINIIIKYLSLSEKVIIELKREKDDIIKKRSKILRCLFIKFILFFILIFIFLLVFWYYLSCFCAVYKNTQMHLIKDTLMSFLLSLLYPFGFNLVPGIFRIPSLKNGNREFIYKIGKALNFIL